MSTSCIIFSADRSYYAAAAEELAEAFPSAEIQRIGPDTGRMGLRGHNITEVTAACRKRPIVFVRHLTQQWKQIVVENATTLPDEIASAAGTLLNADGVDGELSLQVWRSGKTEIPIRTDELWRQIAAHLTHASFQVARGNREHTLSILLAGQVAIVGLNRRDDALADWPGGRVGLAKSHDQVSRSEFKLEELLKVYDVPLPAHGIALDLGASPGGWTRILRDYGLEVWAVDPADLDRRVAIDPDVHHVRTTAGVFLHTSQRTFNVIVNDMRMAPALSCQLMLDAAQRLHSGGQIIVTLKLSPRQPLKTVRDSLTTLSRVYEIHFARQLYHNRNEVTVVGSLRPPVETNRASKRDGPSP